MRNVMMKSSKTFSTYEKEREKKWGRREEGWMGRGGAAKLSDKGKLLRERNTNISLY
jgi:hypothetical protein